MNAIFASSPDRCAWPFCPNRDVPNQTMSKCARCWSAYYCGVACQREDWRSEHRLECPDLANARFLIELPEINNQLEDLERMDKEIRALDDQNRRLLIPTKGIDAFANKVSSLQTEVSMEDLNEAGKYLEFANQFLSGCDRVLKLCGEEKAVFLTTRSTLQFLKSTGRGKETRMRACLVGMEDSIGGLERREMHDYHIKEAAKCIKSVRDKLAELSQNHQALLATCAVIGAMRKSAQQNKPS